MNKKLKKLYEAHWNSLVTEVQKLSHKAAQPLLLKVRAEYENADIKVMLIGQETNGWGSCFNEKQETIDDLMRKYETYFYETRKTRKQDIKRKFWNESNFKYFENKLEQHFNKLNVGFIWNNISKIGNYGQGKGMPHKTLRNLERKYFNVIQEEISILKPDIIIFTTGSRDAFIKHHFGAKTAFIPLLSFNGDSEPLKDSINLLAEVQLENFKNIIAIRVQHPNRRALKNSIILRAIIKTYFRKHPTQNQ